MDDLNKSKRRNTTVNHLAAPQLAFGIPKHIKLKRSLQGEMLISDAMSQGKFIKEETDQEESDGEPKINVLSN